jgi:hypothetical protein
MRRIFLQIARVARVSIRETLETRLCEGFFKIVVPCQAKSLNIDPQLVLYYGSTKSTIRIKVGICVVQFTFRLRSEKSVNAATNWLHTDSVIIEILGFSEDIQIAIDLEAASISNNKVNKITDMNHTESIIRVGRHDVRNVENETSDSSRRINLCNVFDGVL